MKRKLIKQGNSALTVTVPSSWTKYNNLEAGDEVTIEEEGDKIVVHTEGNEKYVEKTISIKLIEPIYIHRILTNCYKAGVDKLNLIFQKEVPIKLVNEIINKYCMGYEITSVDKRLCTITNYSVAEESQIDQLIRKNFFIVKEIQNTILNDIDNKKFENLTEISMMLHNVQKLCNYAIRVSIKTIKNNNIIQYNRNIFTQLYLYTRKLLYIYLNVKNERVKPRTTFLLKELFELFNEYHKAYLVRDIDKIYNLGILENKLKSNLSKYADKGNGRILQQISMANRCIKDSLGSCIGLGIDN